MVFLSKFKKVVSVAATMFLLLPGTSMAQEAYIGQIGDDNTAANVDLSGNALLAIAQVGDDNTSVQINAQGENILASAQLGNRNTSLSLVNGTNNFVGTVQLGFGHTATSWINGNANHVLTVQSGGLNRSQVDLIGNDATAMVTQAGFGLRANLNVRDSYIGPASGTEPLNVGINQSQGDQSVDALVTRDQAGTITIRPGNATTVLQLPG